MRKDLYKYLSDLQVDADRMRDACNEAIELANKGELPQEQADMISGYFNTVYSNVQRVSYCIYLLDLPAPWIRKVLKFIDKKCEEIRLKKEEKFAEDNADADSVAIENLDAITAVEAIVEDNND